MALWMILAVCLTDLIDANGNDGWESVTQFQRDSNISKNNFKYFANIESGECNNESLEKDNAFTSIWGFTESLKFVMDNKEKLPELYTSAEDSLNHYLTVCGLEERYQKMIQQLASAKGEQSDSASKQTLATQMLNAFSHSLESQQEMIWVIQLVRASGFPLAKIECDNPDYIETLAKGLRMEKIMPLHDYALNLIQEHLMDCGHEDYFERVAKKSFDPTSVEKYPTFDEYVRSVRYNDSRIVWAIKIVGHLASIAAREEPSCDDLSVSERWLHLAKVDAHFVERYPTLKKYAEDALTKHISKCRNQEGPQ